MKITKDIVKKIHSVLDRGLCVGVGKRSGRMCVEAAVCYALGEPHGDEPSCVAPDVREFKISLNDCALWGTPADRAEGMRALAIAQLGSTEIDSEQFRKRIALRVVREILPPMLEWIGASAHAKRCAGVASIDAAEIAVMYALQWANTNSNIGVYSALSYAYAGLREVVNTDGSAGGSLADAVREVALAAHQSWRADADSPSPRAYLEKAAQIALETLQQLGSPGCKWL